MGAILPPYIVICHPHWVVGLKQFSVLCVQLCLEFSWGVGAEKKHSCPYETKERMSDLATSTKNFVPLAQCLALRILSKFMILIDFLLIV